MSPPPRLLLTSATRGGGMQVARLTLDGDSPRRILVLAEARVTTVPQGRRGQAFVDALTERLWLRSQQGLLVDVLQGSRSSLAAFDGPFVAEYLKRYDLVLALLGPSTARAPRASGRETDALEHLLTHLPASTSAALVRLHDDEYGSVREQREPPLRLGRRSGNSSVVRLHAPNNRTDSASRLVDHLIAHLPMLNPPSSSVALLEHSRTDRLRTVALFTRSSFEVEQATIDLLQGSTTLTRAVSVGGDCAPDAQTMSLSEETLRRGSYLVLADALSATPPREACLPVQFYAGYPLRSPAGSRLGTLNIYDGHGRPDESFNVAAMRDLARLAEAELAP